MRVIVATTTVPFVCGGAEYLASALSQALVDAGHEVDRFDLPFSSYYPSMPDQMMALRLIDLSGYGDRLITIRTPSYLLRHENKVCWFVHHHRPTFDLWGTKYQDVAANAFGLSYRTAFRSADDLALRECRSVFANSHRMASRLLEYNNLRCEVLYPPLGLDHTLYSACYGNYILCAGRLTHHKRQHLCVEALRYTRTDVRLLIAGPADTAGYVEELESTIARYGLEQRATLLARWLDEDEKADLFAHALAIAYAPFDEDSYGYVTLEAARSRKAVVTCSDSGGVLEFVENNVSGFVCPPDPEAIAGRMDDLWDRSTARRMGAAAYDKLRQLNISWSHTLERLLS